MENECEVNGHALVCPLLRSTLVLPMLVRFRLSVCLSQVSIEGALKFQVSASIATERTEGPETKAERERERRKTPHCRSGFRPPKPTRLFTRSLTICPMSLSVNSRSAVLRHVQLRFLFCRCLDEKQSKRVKEFASLLFPTD